MADDVVRNPDEMSGISDASDREPTPEPAVKTPDPASTAPDPATTPDPAAKTADPHNKAPDPKRAAPTQTPPAPGTDQSEDGYDGSKFLPNQTAEALKKILTISALDPHLEERLRAARLRLNEDRTGILIDMPQNGHTLHCGKMKDGTEFIGMPNKKMLVDEHDAFMMVGLAKGRGWKAINVNGTKEEQELLWIEATRQGLAVANFQPDPNSELIKKFMEQQANTPKASVTPADPDPAPQPQEDFHLKTMKLLQDKSGAATDKDVKSGLEDLLKKFQDGTAIHGDEAIYKGLSEALSDKNERDAFNKVAEFLNKTDGKLAIAKLEAAPVAQPAAAAPKADGAPPPPKADAPTPV